MSQLIANADCIVTPNVVGGTAVATITSIPATKELLNGKGIYFGDMDVEVSGAAIPGVCVQVAPETLTISPSSTKLRRSTDGTFPIRLLDSVTGSVSGQNPNTGAACTIPVTLTITNAGQSKGLVD